MPKIPSFDPTDLGAAVHDAEDQLVGEVEHHQAGWVSDTVPPARLVWGPELLPVGEWITLFQLARLLRPRLAVAWALAAHVTWEDNVWVCPREARRALRQHPAKPLDMGAFGKRVQRIAFLRLRIAPRLHAAVASTLQACQGHLDLRGLTPALTEVDIPDSVLSAPVMDFGDDGLVSAIEWAGARWVGVRVRLRAEQETTFPARAPSRPTELYTGSPLVKRSRGRPAGAINKVEMEIREQLKNGKLSWEDWRNEKVEALASRYGTQHQRISELRKKILPENPSE